MKKIIPLYLFLYILLMSCDYTAPVFNRIDDPKNGDRVEIRNVDAHAQSGGIFVTWDTFEDPLITSIRISYREFEWQPWTTVIEIPSIYNGYLISGLVNDTIYTIQLQTLYLGYIYRTVEFFGIPGDGFVNLAAITDINLRNTVQNISSNISLITVLDISDATLINDLTGISQLTELRFLILPGKAFLDLAPLRTCNEIIHLDISNNINISNISALGGLPKLKYLNISGMTNLWDGGISGLSSLSNLETLVMKDITLNISSTAPLSSLQNLKSLDMSNSTSTGDLSGLFSLKELRYLKMKGCTAVTDISPLAGLENLNTLDMSGCTNITNINALMALGSLEILDLSGCTGLTTHIPALSLLPNLKVLNLQGCTNIPPSDIAYLQSLPNLTVIY